MGPELWWEWAASLDHSRFVRGPGAALLLLVVAGVSLVVVRLLERLRALLEPRGLLPRAIDLGQLGLRTGAVAAIAVAGLALVPSAFLPLLALGGAAGALGLGWTAPRWAPDLLAGIQLVVSGELRPGAWIQHGDVAGIVQRVGLRTSRVVARDRTVHDLPNDRLVREGFAHDPSPWPRVAVRLAGTGDLSKAVRQAGLLSPWRAPDAVVDVVAPEQPGDLWVVRTRVVSWDHADDHERSVRRLFRESVGHHDGMSDIPSRVRPTS